MTENIQAENIKIYTENHRTRNWLNHHLGAQPIFVCVLGFTATSRIPGISAAGLTPQDREFTACADAEFLYFGVKSKYQYPLPPLTAGASPVFITRAVTENLNIPTYILNAGLSVKNPFAEIIDLQGSPAQCLTTGKAMDLGIVRHLLFQGLAWGEKLSQNQSLQNQSSNNHYLIISECVVAGTTTALAVLTGLGINAKGKVNSSHPVCNHDQKWEIVQRGLQTLGKTNNPDYPIHPLKLVAAVGDPMQIVVAAIAIAASRRGGVLLAGGTQMLAVYTLASAIATTENLTWKPDNIVVGTTRWVAEDPTGATIELANSIGNSHLNTPTPPLIATPLNFTNSRFRQLQAYEQGFVKEGVGAGASAIAASLYANWDNSQLLNAIEHLLERYIISC